MDKFERMVWKTCEPKDFEDHQYVVKQLITFSRDVEFLTRRCLPREKVIKRVLKNLDKVRFTPEYIPKYFKKSEGGLYYWINGVKGIEVVDPEKEYSLIHELVHNLAVYRRNHGIRMNGNRDSNFSLDDGMAEYITRLLWKQRYPNAKAINRFETEVGFAIKTFGLLGEERGILLYLTNAKKVISEIEKLNSEEYSSEQNWDVLNRNLDKLRTTRGELRKQYIDKAEEAVQMLYIAKSLIPHNEKVGKLQRYIRKSQFLSNKKDNKKGLILLNKVLTSLESRKLL